MTGTKHSLSANIMSLCGTGKIRQRILLHLLPLYLLLPRRHNFKQMAAWGCHNETTYHNWFKKDLDLLGFNLDLVAEHGSGDHFVIFDPCFLAKSGKKTPSKGNFWSGCARAVRSGLEMSSFAIGDLAQHTAYHFTSSLTPAPKDLKQENKTLMDYYVSQVVAHQKHIAQFGNLIVSDAYFGVLTFVKPVLTLGIDVVSCLKTNACLYYVPPPQQGPRKRGRPAVKDGKIDWDNLDKDRLPILEQDAEKIVRSAKVYVKCLKMTVLLVAVDYLKEDGTLQKRKLYFSTRLDHTYDRVLSYYQCRFQIEYLFRDAKQFTGLTHCQSTNQTKLTNHINIALTAVSVAKATHWQKDKPFSMAQIKQYYYNLKMVEQFAKALGIDPNTTKKNPKIKELLFSMSYDVIAA